MLAVRLPPEIDSRLEDLVAQKGRDKRDPIVEASAEHIDDLEDVYFAKRRLIENRAEVSNLVSLEDLMKLHGSAD